MILCRQCYYYERSVLDEVLLPMVKLVSDFSPVSWSIHGSPIRVHQLLQDCSSYWHSGVFCRFYKRLQLDRKSDLVQCKTKTNLFAFLKLCFTVPSAHG
jgi:hypothetical protein